MNALHHAANSAASGIARYDILDTPPEPAFDDLARRAADALGTKMAAISFFDRIGAIDAAELDGKLAPITREWFKARIGVPFAALVQEHCFYLPALSNAPKRPTVFVIADALADKRFCGHISLSARRIYVSMQAAGSTPTEVNCLAFYRYSIRYRESLSQINWKH